LKKHIVDKIGHVRDKVVPKCELKKKRKTQSRVEKLVAEEKFLRNEMSVIHCNESSCHLISEFIEIRKLGNFLRGFRDECDDNLVPE
jgi:hypothetical protein